LGYSKGCRSYDLQPLFFIVSYSFNDLNTCSHNTSRIHPK